jgi:hypothetical protein
MILSLSVLAVFFGTDLAEVPPHGHSAEQAAVDEIFALFMPFYDFYIWR